MNLRAIGFSLSLPFYTVDSDSNLPIDGSSAMTDGNSDTSGQEIFDSTESESGDVNGDGNQEGDWIVDQTDLASEAEQLNVEEEIHTTDDWESVSISSLGTTENDKIGQSFG